MLLRVKISDFISLSFFGALLNSKVKKERKHERKRRFFWLCGKNRNFLTVFYQSCTQWCLHEEFLFFNSTNNATLWVCFSRIHFSLPNLHNYDIKTYYFVGETFKVVAFSISQLTRDTCLRLTKRQQLKLNKYARNDNINFHLPHQFSQAHTHTRGLAAFK